MGRQQLDPGPFYVVWEKPAQRDPHAYPWPYQLATIESTDLTRTYPHIAPSTAPDGAPAWEGFRVFRTECIACHAINGEGGTVGPDLNVPRSVVEYRPVEQLKSLPVANAYMTDPIKVTVGRLVRIYLVNITEFDLINSFHLHGMFFDVFRPGTRTEPSEHTDTITLCQGERAILETTFRYPGDYMFHAHQSEFAELGWMGLFRAEGARRES